MVDSNEFYREGLCEELLLNDNSILDDFFDPFLRCLIFEVSEHQAGTVTMKTLEYSLDYNHTVNISFQSTSMFVMLHGP